jgi:hypothetical protein
MNNNTKTTVGGTSFCNLLFLVFLVLKLTKVITWSWWWVTAPLWIPIAILVGILVIGLVLAIIGAGITPRKDRWS